MLTFAVSGEGAEPENGGAESFPRLFGTYELQAEIGRGGMGLVFKARQLPLDRVVALKVLLTGQFSDETARRRFRLEAESAAKLQHPNIVTIYEVGEAEGHPYLTMDFVDGPNLAARIGGRPLPARTAAELLRDIARAVQVAHAAGVLHRDLKPSNILIGPDERPRVTDFGLAKRLDGSAGVTLTGQMLGSPNYISPEQAAGRNQDIGVPSDIYGLGALLYQLLTGRAPFNAPTPAETLRLVLDTEPASPRLLNPALPRDLETICLKCLQKDPARRYASATAIVEDLDRFLSDRPIHARPPNLVYRARKYARRNRTLVIAVSVVLGSLVIGLGMALAGFRRAVSAERAQNRLRQEAVVARELETKRAARTALDLANRNLADGKIADGLAYLVYAARKDPQNTTLAPRLASAMAAQNFLLPAGAPFECDFRILAVRFTKDGKSIYVGAEDGTFRVLDADSGELKREFHLGRPVALGGWKFARDNDRVLAVLFANHTLGVFEAESGQPRWTPGALDPNVIPYGKNFGLGDSIGFSPDGRWFYAFAQDRFWLWDAATGAIRLQPILGHEITDCDITADGMQLAVTAGGSVKRWTLTEPSPVSAPGIPVNLAIKSSRTVRFSPDGRKLAISAFTEGVRLVDVASGALLRTLPLPGDILDTASVAFASHDRLFASGYRAAGSWSLLTGEFTPLPIAVGEDLVGTSFDSAGRRILATGTDGFVRLCDLDSGDLVAETAWHQDGAFCAALSPDGAHVVIGTASGMILRLRVGRGAARPVVLPRTLATPMPAPFLPESPARLLWMTGDRARVLDIASGREVTGGFAYPEAVVRMEGIDYRPPVRPDLKFMVVDTGHGWQAWELGAGGVTHVAILAGSRSGGGPPMFSPRGDLVALCYKDPSSDEFSLGVWNLHTGARAGPVFTYPTWIVNLTPNFSPDGRRIAFGTADGACMVLDVATARPLVTFASRSLVPNQAVWFSPDGTRVLTSTIQNETRLWDAATGQPISPVLDTMDANGFAQFSPDGRRFATWGSHSTHVWDGRTGAPVGEPLPAGGKQVRFSSDSRNLSTADANGIVRVWDVPSGQPVTEPMSYRSARTLSPEFSPDGRFLRTETKEFFVWSVPPRLPVDSPIPEWLLQLATVCATKTVDDAGQLIDVPDVLKQFEEVQHQLAALPADAPLAEWGRWIIDNRSDRSIAPGFTITPEEADKLAKTTAAAGAPNR
ncbi:MAG TPA: serine/threonine-protein kinase [Opitutaceae bacterium]|nr:serine/threonine-protein kinase [Opitutaceae bacterium]